MLLFIPHIEKFCSLWRWALHIENILEVRLWEKLYKVQDFYSMVKEKGVVPFNEAEDERGR